MDKPPTPQHLPGTLLAAAVPLYCNLHHLIKDRQSNISLPSVLLQVFSELLGTEKLIASVDRYAYAYVLFASNSTFHLVSLSSTDMALCGPRRESSF